MLDPRSLELVEAIQKLSFCRSLSEIIDIVRISARKIARSDGATFILKEGNLCHYVDEDAIGPLFKGKHFPMQSCIGGLSMIKKDVIVVRDIDNDERIPPNTYSSTFVKSLCITPIRIEDPQGAIGLYWKDETVPTADTIRMLSVLANSTSTAIENTSLHTQLHLRLEQVNRLSHLKDEFLRNLSHELRTPLNQILGWSQILKEPHTDAEFQEGIEAIERSGRRQEAIIQDLLDCSSMLQGEVKFRPENFDPGDLMEQLLTSFKTAIEAKRIQLDVQSLSTGSYVHADKERSLEILRHLMSNAIKFTPLKGRIFIQCMHDDEHSIVTFRDEGIGIEKSYLPKVFDLFSQGHDGLSRNFSGTGMGLSLSRYLAEAQGGKIEIASDGLGHGTTATLKLPMSAIRFDQNRVQSPEYLAGVLEHLIGPRRKLSHADAGMSG